MVTFLRRSLAWWFIGTAMSACSGFLGTEPQDEWGPGGRERDASIGAPTADASPTESDASPSDAASTDVDVALDPCAERSTKIPLIGGTDDGFHNTWIHGDAGHVATKFYLTAATGAHDTWSFSALERCSVVLRIPLVAFTNASSSAMNLVEIGWTEASDRFLTLKTNSTTRYRVSPSACLTSACSSNGSETADVPIYESTVIEIRIRHDGASIRVNIEDPAGGVGTLLDLPPQPVTSSSVDVAIGLRGTAGAAVTYGPVESWREPY